MKLSIWLCFLPLVVATSGNNAHRRRSTCPGTGQKGGKSQTGGTVQPGGSGEAGGGHGSSSAAVPPVGAPPVVSASSTAPPSTGTGTSKPSNATCTTQTITDHFKKFDDTIWQLLTGSTSDLHYSSKGLDMVLTTPSDITGALPAIVLSTKLEFLPPAFFEIDMQSSAASGCISTAIFFAGTGSDEIDLEFTGLNSEAGDAPQTVVWSKGQRVTFSMDAVNGISPSSGFHKWRVDWTTSSVTLSVDGKLVRTMSPVKGLGWPVNQGLPFRMGPWLDDSPGWAGVPNAQKDAHPTQSVHSITISGCVPH